jgi:DNA polymerase-3 subunit delta
MKILPRKDQIFLQQDYKNYSGILIFGSDTSLVLNKILSIENNVFSTQSDASFSKIAIQYEEIEEDPSLLQHELSSMNLLNTQKIIIIDNTQKSIKAPIKSILLQPKTQHILIFRAGELPTSSSIRKLFETEKNLAALHCYSSNNTSTKALLLRKIAESRISIDHKLIDFIADNIRGEHSTILSEIEKIIHYTKENRSISFDEVIQIISNPSEKNSYDPLIHSIIDKDFILAEQELEKLTSSGVHLVAIARNVANYFVKLLKVQTLIKQGMPEKFALDSPKPPIFFKNIPHFKKGLHQYSVKRISYIIYEFTQLEINYKSKNISPEILWEKCFYNIFIKDKEST